MKKKIIIITIAIIVLCGLGILTYIYFDSKNIKTPPTPEIPTYTEVELDTETFINSLKEISIVGTDDTFIVTKKVKWEVPEVEGATTVSFAIEIPYKFIVDGVEYEGTYEFYDYTPYTLDKNPKYDLKITDLTNNGEIEILISKK